MSVNMRETEVEPQAVDVTLSVSLDDATPVEVEKPARKKQVKVKHRMWPFEFPSNDEIRSYVEVSRGRDDVRAVVYFAQCLPFMKIGITRDLSRRDFETMNPFDVQIRMVLRAQFLTTARYVERHLHRHFRETHHRGEWFRLMTSEVRAIERDAKALIARIDDATCSMRAEWAEEAAERRLTMPEEFEPQGVREDREKLAERQEHARRLNSRNPYKPGRTPVPFK